MTTLFRRILAPATALLAIGSAAEARAPQVARPALWEVSDPDTKVYLFGTIHLLPAAMKWRSAKLDEALSN